MANRLSQNRSRCHGTAIGLLSLASLPTLSLAASILLYRTRTELPLLQSLVFVR